MKAMTVRGIDSEMAAKLRETAQKQGKSVNQIIIDFIQKSLGLDKEPKYTRVHDDLDHLFGSWSQEQFDLIQNKITSERTIDPELWQ